MAQWWRRVRARVTGAVSPELAQTLVQLSQASARLNELVGSGSIVSAEDRSVVLASLAVLRTTPGVFDADLLEKADALESRLMAAELSALESEEVLLWPWSTCLRTVCRC